jgi:O-acetylserine/cysteine efflux transporter
MPTAHLLLALVVVFVWGTNFVVIQRGLDELPPFLLAALRFGFSAVPLIFFLKRPAVDWRKLAAFGLLIGVGQFGLMFFAMRGHVTPGLASLMIQTQVFFTIGLAAWMHGEPVRPMQGLALVLALAGMATIAWWQDGSVTMLGMALMLLAAMSWAAGNLVARAVGRVDALAFMAWSSLFAAPPLLACSLMLEGSDRVMQALSGASAIAWLVVAWQVVGNSLFGYGVWTWLLARHAAAKVSPLALLVPVFGMSSSALVLGESLDSWKLVAAALIVCALAVNALATRPR